jgi:uncharacterized membrane protein YfcA
MTVTRHEPRKVVGTTNAAEFVVAVSVSSGFLTGAAQHGIPWMPVLGLVLGGVLVAPFAARLAAGCRTRRWARSSEASSSSSTL